jgi:thiol-disulfide isomerase/thioredoxin
MNRKILAVISMVVVVGAIIYFNQKSRLDSPVGSASGATSPLISELGKLPGFDALSIQGHPFMVHFWAKWCAPCAEEIPHLIDFAKTAEQKLPGLVVVAVSLDPSLEVSRSILPNQGKDLPSNFKLFLDSEHQVAEGMGSYQYPETFFFDSKGRVVEKWVGPQKWNQAEVMDYFLRRWDEVSRSAEGS